MIIGDGIVRLRQFKNLTQQELADATGRSQQCISQYETGVSIPCVEWLIEVANRYDVSIDFLVGCSPKPKGEQISVDALHLLESYETLNEDEKRLILNIIKALRSARSVAGGVPYEE
jgi:transcriptional regulator with XRE-family HTH domain